MSAYPFAGALLVGFAAAFYLPSAWQRLNAWMDREIDTLVEDALGSLVDTDLEPAHKPLSMSPAARRIREQMAENQREAEVRKFREELDAFGGGAA